MSFFLNLGPIGLLSTAFGIAGLVLVVASLGNRSRQSAAVGLLVASVALGLQLAGPILVMVWLVNVLVAVLARLAPKMNVFFSVGMTLTSSLGILLLAVSLPWLIAVHHEAVRQAVAALGPWLR